MEPQVKREILVVGPDYLQNEFAENVLRTAGFDVCVKGSADEGQFALLEPTTRFDLAVVEFPYIDGSSKDTKELLGILREREVPRVIVSALNEENLIQRWPLQNGEGYLEKPYREEALRQLVEKMLQ